MKRNHCVALVLISLMMVLFVTMSMSGTLAETLDGAVITEMETSLPTAQTMEADENPLSDSLVITPQPEETVEEFETVTPEVIEKETQSQSESLTVPADTVTPKKQDSLETANIENLDNSIELATPAPSEEPTDPIEQPTTEDTNAPDETSLEEESEPEEANDIPVAFTVRWTYEIDALPHSMEITLKAESYQGFSAVKIRWQAAKKEQAQLKEDEEEWVDIASETTATLVFALKEEMLNWRWRLHVIQTDGTSSFSDEMRLPEDVGALLLTDTPTPSPEETALPEDSKATPDEAADDEMLDEAVLETPLPQPEIEEITVPWATITFTAEEPDQELTLGSAVLLQAEIFNTCDNMQTQWQYFDQSAETWMDVQDATELTYRYVLDEANCLHIWRLLITVPLDETTLEPDESENEQESEVEESTPPVEETTLNTDDDVNMQEAEIEEKPSTADEATLDPVEISPLPENQPPTEDQVVKPDESVVSD